MFEQIWHFGKEESSKFGNLITDRLAGYTISKRVDLAELPGGIKYEANKLGIDLYEMLRALEGMCFEGRAREIDDSTYLINHQGADKKIAG